MMYQKFKSVLLSVLIVSGAAACGSSSSEPPPASMPEVFVTNTIFNEGTAATREANVRFNLTSSSEQTVTLDYSTSDLSAKQGLDYASASGSVEFAPGETAKDVVITTITNDEDLEFNEFFRITISNVQNATLPVSTVDISILDNDTYTPSEDADGFITPDSYPGLDLVWSEEFDQGELNTADWNYEIGDGCPNLCGWGNNELQSYDEESTTLDNGRLIITAQQNASDPAFTSSRLTTKGKQQFQYGRIDIRAKLPEGQGIWPAIWMLGSNIDQVGWPVCGEIDIMELVGHEPNVVHGTAHYDRNGHNFQGESLSLDASETFGDKYHIFTILWQEGSIQWYVDYQPFYSINSSQVGVTYPFNSPFFFIVNIAVGGNWPGNPDNTTVFPQQLDVDYIRVFQHPDL